MVSTFEQQQSKNRSLNRRFDVTFGAGSRLFGLAN